jgi:ribosomal protein L7Ae-like RNA K-turn-binding protein
LSGNSDKSDKIYNSDKIDKNKIANGLGLAKKAGAVTAGTALVIDSVRKKKAVHVFLCSDASVGTVKKLCDKSAFYQIPVTRLDLTMSELAKCVGLIRPTAAVSLTDKNFLKLIGKSTEVYL